ncbi:hypothetical protein E1180_12875 [Roseibium denhamense]|nr:YcaO-like family protein [Roseibium denhamense]MTI06410.1 hypothetical protein [Roseibium denhamense]
MNFEGSDVLPSKHSDTTPKEHVHGTHRLVSPAVTLQRLKPHLKTFGITRVANVTGLDTIGLPVVAVYRPNARSLSVSQGKGLNLDSARVSGIMEAIEGYHAEHVTLPLRHAHFAELSEDGSVIDVAGLPRMVGGIFDPFRPILWCQGTELNSGRSTWVPFETVHTNFSYPLPPTSGNFQMSSNGLASGNHWLEAVSHGICELIERDALTLWAETGGPESSECRLDLATVDDPDCRFAIDLLSAANQAIGVWDISTDIGLPVFSCTIADRDPNHLGQFYCSHGSGCHLTRDVALLRALTEAAQTRLTFIAGARDDAHRDFFEAARNPDRVGKHRDQIESGVSKSMRTFSSAPSFAHSTFEEDVSCLLQKLGRVGLSQVVAVDLGGRVPGIEVVRVIVPGLEGLHDAPGYCVGKRSLARRAAYRRGPQS